MKLTVLTDNNTIIDRYYLGEPALSFYMEDGDRRILFDTGYSDVFLRNAEALGIDLHAITDIVLSHGHNDHTGGLRYLMEYMDCTKVRLTAHPGVFAGREYEGLPVGSPVTEEECRAHGMQVELTRTPVKISDHLTFLGEIPRVMPFESAVPIGMVTEDGVTTEDYVMDDSALVFHGEEGIFVITGCSHSGICNITEYAQSLTEDTLPVQGIIGGFHLMKDDRQLRETVSYLKEHVTGTLCPCHCVSLYAKHCLMKELPVKEVGVGMTLELK